ncbi:hypothetical protein [Jongsikchunia kroppenstedtii]|uniref:hypothetical protein n=1 Tax=Jongsikchunia kroppenstedtii TaxID=1121721 RepID=UPI0003705AE6|nr:hypothetical protein [Jongsikchunia kroppenstedtii]
MTLSKMDDYPLHQVAEVIRHVETSDRNFYDRYYFNCHNATADAPFVVIGLGVYPNLGVVDCFAAVRYRDDQVVFRGSRALGADRSDTSVGPFKIEVIEGLEKLRVTLEPSDDYDVSFDITWDADIPAVLEPRHFYRQIERVTFDTQRFAQTGWWSGEITVDGDRFEVDPKSWRGSRDRSWGVRPIGEPEPAGRRATISGTFYWNYVVMQFEDSSIVMIIQEDQQGRRVMDDVTRVWKDDRDNEWLGHVTHDVSFISGTRDVSAAKLTFTRPTGEQVVADVEIIQPHFFGFGSGYGLEQDWRHGMWQGDLVTGGLRYKVDELDKMLKLFCPTEYLAKFTLHENGETKIGYGLFEFGAIGPHDQYGFKEFIDVAP